MPKSVYNKFNRGEIDPIALARDDVEKVNNSCELMENFIPKRLGAMQYRSGTEYLSESAGYFNRMIPFVKSVSDKAILEFYSTGAKVSPDDNGLRILLDGVPISRTAVTSTLANQTFDANITSWTTNDGAGSSSFWLTGGYLALRGAGDTRAETYQTVADTQTGAEHSITVTVAEAPVTIKIGESGVGSTEIYEGVLGVGVHSLVFTPSANFTITLSNSAEYRALVDSVVLDGAGVLDFKHDIDPADLPSIRYAQSADVLFITRKNGAPIKVERRGQKSWSLTEFKPYPQPFGLINNSEIKLTPSALNGNALLTANNDFFKPEHVGSQFKLSSTGQNVNTGASSAPVSTNSIRVTGVGNTRKFNISVSSANFTGSQVKLEQSLDDLNWTEVEAYNTTTFKTYDDTADNVIYYYRLTCNAYGGTVVSMTLSYSGGGIDGICEVTGYNSATSADIKILQDFGATVATRDWYESQWSGVKGYPTCVHLFEGRLWFAGNTNLWGSVSDEYENFDRTIEGDSSSIYRTVGFGAVESVEWLLDAGRMVMGIASDEIAVRSSSFGEILTNSNCNLRSGTSQGVAPVEPVKIDNSIFYVQRSGVKVMRATYSVQSDSHDALDMMTLHEDIAIDGIKRIAVSRQPETRLYVLLDTGELRVFLFDPVEDVKSWSRITMAQGHTIQDIVVLPATGEDEVYISVVRDVKPTCLIERFSPIRDYVARHFDSAIVYVSPSTTITGLTHLNGETVGVFADGQDRGDFVVSGGQITVPSAWTDVCVGLRYTANYKSNKLGQYANYSVLSERVRVYGMGILGRNIYPNSIQFGSDFNTLEPMPEIESGQAVDTTAIFNEYDYTPIEFNGVYDTNSRVCIRATNPCLIMALTYYVKDSFGAPSQQG